MATAMEIPRTKPKPNKNRCVYRWMFFEHHVDKHNVDRWRRSQTMSMRQNNYSEAFCVFQTKNILSLVHGVCAFDLASWSERILRAAPVCHCPGALRLILAQAKRMLFYFIFFPSPLFSHWSGLHHYPFSFLLGCFGSYYHSLHGFLFILYFFVYSCERNSLCFATVWLHPHFCRVNIKR